MTTRSGPGGLRDRAEAGRALGERVRESLTGPSTLVLGLPRGGVPVAAAVAAAVGAPLDVLVVRKLRTPGRAELAMGAVGPAGSCVVEREVVRAHRVAVETLAAVVARESEERAALERRLRGDRPPPVLGGREVVAVDDGLATGASMRAAVLALRASGPSRVVVAVPVAAADAVRLLHPLVDDLVCLSVPRRFIAVGTHYGDFSPITEERVRDLLAAAVPDGPEHAGPPPG